MEKKLLAYKRQDGSIGIRNYILILSTVHCSNSVAEKIAQKTDIVAIVHEYGYLDSEVEHNSTILGLTHAAQNLIFHSVLVVGLGCEQTRPEHDRRKYVILQENYRICIYSRGGEFLRL